MSLRICDWEIDSNCASREKGVLEEERRCDLSQLLKEVKVEVRSGRGMGSGEERDEGGGVVEIMGG